MLAPRPRSGTVSQTAGAIMGREDWYRRESWTQADQDAFWQRLSRSRASFHRAQYLRIQAAYLEGAGILDAAVSLLEKALLEEPDGTEVAQIHHQLATCCEKQCRLPEAFEHLRSALAAEVRRPNWQTGASLTFGRIAVESGSSHLYEEVLQILTAYAERRSSGVRVASARYLHAAIMALIHQHFGDATQAGEFARLALSAASETRSPFRNHPQFGLVTDKDTRLYEMVARLANAG